MDNGELWTKTWKTTGAMVGASVLFLGATSLLLLLFFGHASGPSSSAHAEPGPVTTAGVKGAELPAPGGGGKRGFGNTRPGESI